MSPRDPVATRRRLLDIGQQEIYLHGFQGASLDGVLRLRLRRHFPDAADFRVLCVAPTRSWVEMLRKAMREKVGHERWFFVAATDLTPESFLSGNIVYSCTEEPRPLVRPGAALLQE